jgi:hypothetical protein
MIGMLKRGSAKLAMFATAAAIAAPAISHAQMWGGSPQQGTVTPYWGNLQPFYGNLQPFYGNLQPFYGNLQPFWGNLQPFWGNLQPFSGDLTQFWGVANPVTLPGAPNMTAQGQFWTTEGQAMGQTFSFWSGLGANAQASQYVTVAGKLQGIVADSRQFWGPAIQARTGQSFDVAFANPLFAKYGIDPNNPASLASMDQNSEARFFLDWYDGLMAYSGADRVDYWMKTANWSPVVSLQSGMGSGATIGLMDQTVVGDASIQQNIIKYSGVSNFTNGHGVAVASLIAAAWDGQGVMGIAPKASLIAYNPFDNSGTANWDAVTTGVQRLKAQGAGVVNASLGVPGETLDEGWNKAFMSLGSATQILKNTVFVIAAGNDGVSQNWDIQWNPLSPAFIVVGSVNAQGQISNFSNRPGTGCLVKMLTCNPSEKLMNNFIVAPGELMLVDDGHGGTTRVSGTSFAAPLVTATIALIEGRWPWLINSPTHVVDIVLNSATDLGAPGVDPVYGHGLLNITAAMSPGNPNSLTWYSVQNGQAVQQSASQAMASYKGGQQSTWDATGAYFSVFEPLGTDVNARDFAIPLSQKLVGQSLKNFSGDPELFQSYLLSRMNGWSGTTGYFQTPNGFMASTEKLAGPWSPDVSVSFAPKDVRYGFMADGPVYQSAMRVAGDRSTLRFGWGDGAPQIAGTGFAQSADYDIERGGANPLLGLASGGGFAAWTYDMGHGLKITTGALARSDRRDVGVLKMMGLPTNSAASVYDAQATLVQAAYEPFRGLTVSGGLTRLREPTGLLGVQSFNPDDFRKGSTSDGATLSVTWQATPDLALAATGTMARSHTAGGQSMVSAGDIKSTAYEAGVTRTNLFAKGDRLQLSVAQPMTVQSGQIRFTDVEVVDRTTGDIGVVTHQYSIAAKTRLTGEAIYVRPLPGGQSDVALFGRVEPKPADLSGVSQGQNLISGVRYRLSF